MRIECTCRGLNENCYRCFGRGYYDDKESFSAIRGPFKRTGANYPRQSFKRRKIKLTRSKNKDIASKGPLSDSQQTIGNITNNEIKNIGNPHSNIGTELINPHSTYIDSLNKRLQLKRSPKHTLMKCPTCGVSVRSDRIKNHVKRVHDYAKNNSLLNSKIDRPVKGGRELSNGHKYNNIVSITPHKQLVPIRAQTRIPSHKTPITILRKRISPSKESNNNRLSVTIAETRIIKPSNKSDAKDKKILDLNKNLKNLIKSDVEVVEKKINADGSKDWYTFRDSCKYGSHPSFDSMDDESLP